MKRIFLCFMTLLALCGSSVFAAMEVTAEDRAFLDLVSNAVRKKDAAWIVSHSALPLVSVSPDQRHLLKKEDYRRLVETALTDTFAATFASEAKKDPFKNYQGVMIGDGLLWFERIRRRESDPWEYAILAFGGFAFQPSEEEANQTPEPMPLKRHGSS